MKNNPYIGPRPYRRGEGNFFGRSREARSLAALIMTNQVLLYYACSGAGKTSLLNARVIPELEENGYYVLPVVRVGSDLPPGISSEQVNNVFAFSALLDLAGESAPLQPLLTSNLLDGLQAHLQAHGVDPQAHPPLLIFDQFEELLTTHRARWEDARGFFIQVRQALEALPSLGVVLAMREDHVAGLDPYAPLLPGRLRGRFRMELMEAPGALEAVQGPAAAQGMAYAEGVASRLVDDLRRIKIQKGEYALTPDQATEAIGQYVELVQLQIVCNRLWANLPDDKTDAIRWEEVERYGDIDKALTGFYEDALKTCQVLRSTPEQSGVGRDLTGLQPLVTERRLRRWFGEQLITPVGTRGLALQGEKETAGLPNPAVEVLDKLHIIRSDVRAGARWYELSHDRLVEPIVQSNRAWEEALARARPWLPVARRWQETEDDSLLYRAKALEEASAWVETNPNDVEPEEIEFVEASQKAERERARRQRWTVLGIAAGALVLAVMLVLTVLAWNAQQKSARSEAEALAQSTLSAQSAAAAATAQAVAEDQRQIAVTQSALSATSEANAIAAKADAEQQARIALSRQLAVQSNDRFEEDKWEIALLLAIEAGRAAETSEAFAAIRQVLARPWRARTLSGHKAYVEGAIWNADGSRILTASADGTARVWDAYTGKELMALSGHGDVYQAIWNADESRILTASYDGTAQVWDAHAGKELVLLSGHKGAVTQVAWNAGESRILTVGDDGTARVWDAETGEQQFVISSPPYAVATAMWNADGSLILAHSRYTDTVWDARTGAQLYTLSSVVEPHRFDIDATWNADGNRLLTTGCNPADGAQGCRERRVRVIDAHTGKELLTLPGDALVTTAQWSPDGTRILTTHCNRWLGDACVQGSAVQVWDAETGQNLFALPGHTYHMTVEWNPNGSSILIAGFDSDPHGGVKRSVQVWGAETGQVSLTLPIQVSEAKWSSKGTRILTNNPGDNTQQAWDAKTGKELGRAPQYDLVWNADEKRALSRDGAQVQVWEVEAVPECPTLVGYKPVLDVSGDRILTIGCDPSGNCVENTAKAWNAQTGEEIAVFSGHAGPITQAIWNADGSRVLTAGDDGTVRLWDAKTTQGLLVLGGHAGSITEIGWDADESHILTTACSDSHCTGQVWDARTGQKGLGFTGGRIPSLWDADKTHSVTVGDDGAVQVWDVTTGEGYPITSNPTYSITQAMWDARGDRILTYGQDRRVRLWNAHTGQLLTEMDKFRFDSSRGVIWSADGTRFLNVTYSFPYCLTSIWDIQTGKIRTLPNNIGDNYQPAWSADGSRVLTPSENNTAKIWDAQTGKVLITFSGQGRILRATWNADESRVLTSSEEDTVQVWNAHTGEELVTLRHAGYIPEAMWNADESRILTAAGGAVRQWYTRIKDLWQAACRQAPRNMTGEEWQQYFRDQSYHKTCDIWPAPSSAVALRIEQAEKLARAGKVQEASSAYQEASQWAKGIQEDDRVQTQLCRSGSLNGFAQLALPACDRAIELNAYPEYHDNRGLARALSGDFDGAIQDFRAAVKVWQESQACGREPCEQREAWVAELEAGRNPFDEETLEALRNE